MKNVTITLDEEVAQWAKVWAAQHDTSVSRMLGDYLSERMMAESGYLDAMQGFLTAKPVRLKQEEAAYPTRDSLYER